VRAVRIETQEGLELNSGKAVVGEVDEVGVMMGRRYGHVSVRMGIKL